MSRYWYPVVSWKLEFEWHDAKAEANLQAHGVSFDLAKTVFKDPFAVNASMIAKTMAKSVLSLSAWQKVTWCYL